MDRQSRLSAEVDRRPLHAASRTELVEEQLLLPRSEERKPFAEEGEVGPAAAARKFGQAERQMAVAVHSLSVQLPAVPAWHNQEEPDG